MTDTKNVFLDLDGTLTDPKEGITKSIQYALERLDQESPTLNELEWTIGPPLFNVFEDLLQTRDSQRVSQAVAYYRERYEDRCHIENEIYEGIPTTLNSLVENGYKLYLATSKPWIYAKKILKYFDIINFFTAVYGSELDGTRDCKEDLLKYILEQHSLNHQSTSMVGDRRFDVNGARHNKIHAIAVTYGYGSLEELNQANPDHLCDHHSELLSILNNP